MKPDRSPDVAAAKLVLELATKGYAIIKSCRTPKFVTSLGEELGPLFAKTPFCKGPFYGNRTKRIGGLLKRSARVQYLVQDRSEEHTSELQSLMRISYAVFCLKKKNKKKSTLYTTITHNN